MKQIKFLVMQLLAMITSLGFMACGGENDEEDLDNTWEIETTEEEEGISVEKSQLIGTWEYDWGNDNNIDYLSFSEDGTGELVEAGNLFTNPEESLFKNSFIHEFLWSLNGDKVNYTLSNGEKGDIKITYVSNKTLTFNRNSFPYSWNTSSPSYSKVSINSNWFWEEGPAAEDLTSKLCGVYSGNLYYNDGSILLQNEKITITQINNYSVDIKNSWTSSLNCTGYVDWNKREEATQTIYRASGAFPYHVTGDYIELGYLNGNFETLTFKGYK